MDMSSPGIGSSGQAFGGVRAARSLGGFVGGKVSGRGFNNANSMCLVVEG